MNFFYSLGGYNLKKREQINTKKSPGVPFGSILPICQRGELYLLIRSADFMNANENIVCAIRTDINHFE